MTETDKTCLVVVLERSFLPALETLLYSLHKTSSFVGVPLIVLTSDTDVINDDFVRSIAYRVIYLGPETISLYKGMSKDRVKDGLKMAELPKYTFLKFNVFRDFGFDRHIVLDTDMVAVNNVDSLLSDSRDNQISVTPLIAKKAFIASGRSLSRLDPADQIEALRIFRDFSKGSHKPNAAYNSGVFVLSKPLLSNSTFDRLISFARDSGGGFEQLIVRDFLIKQEISIGHLSNLYNVTRLTLEHIGIDNYRGEKERFGFVHFTGATKPWNASGSAYNWIDEIWTEFHQESRPWVENIIAGSTKLERHKYFGGMSFPKGVRFSCGSALIVDDRERRGNAIIQSSGVTQPLVSWTWRELNKSLSPECCVDVGANYGEVSLFTEYDPSVDIFVIEANYTLIPFLRSSIALHPQRAKIKLFHTVVSSSAEHLRFGIDHQWSGTSSIVASPEASDPLPPRHRPVGSERIEIVEMKSSRLSDIVRPDLYGKLLVKLDVEGAELAALSGFKETLDSADSFVILSEYNPRIFADRVADSVALIEFFMTVGDIYVKARTKFKRMASAAEAVAALSKPKKHDILVVRGDAARAAVNGLRYPKWL